MSQRFFQIYPFLFFVGILTAQVDYTANDVVPAYDGRFRPAVNLGQYPGYETTDLALLAAGNGTPALPGVGAKALRPGLFGDYVENYGYAEQLPAYQQFEQLGLSDHTLIVGFPPDWQREPNFYCATEQSTLYANLYEPIWDDNNGTAINENNFYAAYLHQLVGIYQDHVHFWEIWNEPGFDYTGAKGWLPPGAPGNWWDNNPDPCDYKLRAPIFHYVRLLRISYEVIKSIDPDAYVVVSGTGYASFLDAILRNTDNPLDGSVTDDFPLGGGAYFDVMGYHSYPHFDGSLRAWNDATNDWDYFRHSDAATAGVMSTRDQFQHVLAQYGYDGATYPQKEWTITEINLPRREFGEFIGSAEAQRNFMIKTAVRCKQEDIWQMQVYKLAEDTDYDDATFEFDLMGLYQRIDPAGQNFQTRNEEGIALATFTDLIYHLDYDPSATAAMDLPAGAAGAAFVDAYGTPTYVVWAKTIEDQSETAAATWDIPAALGDRFLLREWDHNQTKDIATLDGSTLELTGTPVFLTASRIAPNALVGCAPFQWQLQVTDVPNAATYYWTFGGDGTPVQSQVQNPMVSFFLPGAYNATLEVYDADDNLLHIEQLDLDVLEPPAAPFTRQISGPIVQFSSQPNATVQNFYWDFGDGMISSDPNPTHVYFQSGTYHPKLIVTGPCGSNVFLDTLTVTAPVTDPDFQTAQHFVPVYPDRFRAGAAPVYSPLWSNQQLANVAAGNLLLPDAPGTGVSSLRAGIAQSFLAGWGADVELSTYQHYANLGMDNNVMTISFPSVDARDPNEYCGGTQSGLFRDLYIPIWDDGANGTPVNDDNPFALYVWQLVSTYGPFVEIYEVYPSPDFDLTGERGWLPPGEPGNWWENQPDPCDLGMAAPVTHYVRQLRIAYEIIKTYDNDAFVAVSGLGFPSFLDVLLRTTDNPADGSVAPGYPYAGGAYFDAVGYKSYPHLDGSTKYFSTDAGEFVYERHSDAAAASIARLRQEFGQVLLDRGFDGNGFPAKEFFVSETNVPRQPFVDYIGGAEVQRNWLMKAWVTATRNGIRQLHLNALAESAPDGVATNENEVMGLFQNLETVAPYEQTPTDEAIALKTTADLLDAAEFDADQTVLLALPDELDGAAYRYADGTFAYVLWAKTTVDQSESATGTYSFPADLVATDLYRHHWDHSATGNVELIAPTNLVLDACPIILTQSAAVPQLPLAVATADATEVCPGEPVQFSSQSTDATDLLWTFPGGTPATSTAANPTVVFGQSGNDPVTLTASNASGNHTATYVDLIVVQPDPVAGFTWSNDGPLVTFEQQASDFETLLWQFPDGQTANGFNPTIYFPENGDFPVTLIAQNDCGADTLTQILTLAAPPVADFTSNQGSDCDFTTQFVHLTALSPDSFAWTFEQGTPATSTEGYPIVSFPGAGIYAVELIASNDYGSDTISYAVEIFGESNEAVALELCENASVTINGTVYDTDNPSGTEIIANANQYGCDSTVHVALTFVDVLETFLVDTIEAGGSVTVGDSTFTEPGQYVVTLTGAGGCDSLVYLDLFLLTTNTRDLAQLSEFRAVPNPFHGTTEIWLELTAPDRLRFELLDAHGRRWWSREAMVFPAGLTKLPLAAELPPGVYWLRVTGAAGQRTRRVVAL